jgi:hypothetical protein
LPEKELISLAIRKPWRRDNLQLSGICGKYTAMTVKDASLFITVTNGFYLLSLIFLISQATVWQQALIHYPLSYAYPFVSLVNFMILISPVILFK